MKKMKIYYEIEDYFQGYFINFFKVFLGRVQIMSYDLLELNKPKIR